MKNSLVAFSVASVLLTSLTVCAFKTDFVAALTATSTSATSTDAGVATVLPDTASSTPSSTASSPAAEAVTASTTATSTTVALPTDGATSTAYAPSSATMRKARSSQASSVKSKPALKLVHVVGSKYVDFFTDGTTIFSFPGDPSIDANLNKPNASIPTHAGLTWVSSKGMQAYDTTSGDLEPNTYAQEENGSFITNASGFPASATSTTLIAFSLLDPTLDASPVSPAPKTTEASVPPSPAHAPAADTSAASTTSPLPDTSASASSTPNASTTTSASSTAAAAMASSTPVVVSATSTATSTAASSSVASSSFASANDNAASTTATQ